MIRPDDLVEIHVGPLGIALEEPQLPPQLPQLLPVTVRQPRHLHGNVGQAGIAQFHIGRGVDRAADVGGGIQSDDAGIVQPDAVVPLIQPPARDQPGGGLHGLHLASQPVLIAVAADAACAVAAHLAQ